VNHLFLLIKTNASGENKYFLGTILGLYKKAENVAGGCEKLPLCV
jgi:hypothetical protein